MTSAAIKLDQVTKTFDGRVMAVDAVTLDIAAGEFFSLLGPSGCGKTTSLRMIAGFEHPDSGRVHVGGRDITDLPVHRRDMGMVFQSYALFPHRTVAENVAFGLRMREVPKPEIERRVAAALAQVALTGFETRKPGQLSGGQQQRVALARALVVEPPVLLCDEPLGALDRKLRQQMQFELKELQKRLGVTLVFVTHDQEEALTMSDQIVVMNNGRIEQMGDPATLYGRPGSVFVANFIGETNLMRSTVSGTEGGLAVLGWNGITIKADLSGLAPAAGDNVYVVLRPEAIHCSASEPVAVNRIKGKVRQRVFKGNHTSLKIAVGEGAMITALLHPKDVAKLDGYDVWVSWKPETTTIIPDRQAAR